MDSSETHRAVTTPRTVAPNTCDGRRKSPERHQNTSLCPSNPNNPNNPNNPDNPDDPDDPGNPVRQPPTAARASTHDDKATRQRRLIAQAAINHEYGITCRTDNCFF